MNFLRYLYFRSSDTLTFIAALVFFPFYCLFVFFIKWWLFPLINDYRFYVHNYAPQSKMRDAIGVKQQPPNLLQNDTPDVVYIIWAGFGIITTATLVVAGIAWLIK